jgi:hypothetical protein
MDINITSENLIITAYNVIRRETRRYDRKSNDAELGNYVKGVVDLQTELYKIVQSQNALDELTEREDN